MQIDPDEGSAIDDYVVVEDGDYTMRVTSVSPSNDADGNQSWMLKLGLVEGERAGRIAVTDWLNFNQRGMHRVRSVLSALGFDVSEAFNVEPDQLIGLVANVRIAAQESTRASDGRVQRRSRVPYDGWAPCPDPERFEAPAHGGGGSGLAADAMPF